MIDDLSGITMCCSSWTKRKDQLLYILGTLWSKRNRLRGGAVVDLSKKHWHNLNTEFWRSFSSCVKQMTKYCSNALTEIVKVQQITNKDMMLHLYQQQRWKCMHIYNLEVVHLICFTQQFQDIVYILSEEWIWIFPYTIDTVFFCIVLRLQPFTKSIS